MFAASPKLGLSERQMFRCTAPPRGAVATLAALHPIGALCRPSSSIIDEAETWLCMCKEEAHEITRRLFLLFFHYYYYFYIYIYAFLLFTTAPRCIFHHIWCRCRGLTSAFSSACRTPWLAVTIGAHPRFFFIRQARLKRATGASEKVKLKFPSTPPPFMRYTCSSSAAGLERFRTQGERFRALPAEFFPVFIFLPA